MLGAFFTVHFACSHYIKQAAVDSLATCWRELQHEHGEHVEVAYSCDMLRVAHSHCRLQVATCPEIAVDASSKSSEAQTYTGSDEFLEFTLELEHIDDRFRVLIVDHFEQGVDVSGKIDTAVRSRKRQLSVIKSLKSIGKAVDPHWKGFVDTSIFGTRRDCFQGKCPRRWTDCWPGSANSMKQVQVFLVMDSSFCASFKNTAACEEYTLGLFRDMNLLYEEQMGISLRPALLLPPDAFEKFWPSIARAKLGKSVDGGEFLQEFSKLSCGEKDQKDYFRRIIGRPVSFFAIFHIIVGENVDLVAHKEMGANNILGLGRVNTVCTCMATGWTRYVRDRPNSETWGTLAHEIGHNFGGRHFFDHRKTKPGEDPNSGILGYGEGVVAGVYAFSEVNKKELCLSISKILREEKDSENQCFLPYYGVRQEDPRFGPSYYLVAVVFGVLLALVGFCMCLLLVSRIRRAKLRRKYKKLRNIHRADVKELQGVAKERKHIIQDTEQDLLLSESKLRQANFEKDALEKNAIAAETVAIQKTEEVELLQEYLQADVEAKKMHQPTSLTPTQSPSSRSVMTGSVSQQRTPHSRQMAAVDGTNLTPRGRERPRGGLRPREAQVGYSARTIYVEAVANPYYASAPEPPGNPDEFSPGSP